MKTTITCLVCLLLLSACQTHKTTTSNTLSTAGWQLVTAASQLSFITNKNKTHRESHTIDFKQGQVNDNQQLQIELDLATVDTMIPIRDQRLRDILFEVEQFPLATISTQLPAQVELLQTITLPFTLDLHGHQQQLQAEVMIQLLDQQLVVTSFNPVAVNGKDFALDDAINKLTKIASLQSIDYGVLVDFKLVFEM